MENLRMLIIGLDGLVPELAFDQYIGVMPNLKNLMESATWGELERTPHYRASVDGHGDRTGPGNAGRLWISSSSHSHLHRSVDSKCRVVGYEGRLGLSRLTRAPDLSGRLATLLSRSDGLIQI